MNDQLYTDSYTQVYKKVWKIIVGRNILQKIVFWLPNKNSSVSLIEDEY